jgi:hypothetical protein
MSATELDFPVRQEDDVIAGRRLAHIGLTAVVVGAVGVFLAGLLVYAAIGVIQPSAAGPRGTQPAPTAIAHIAQTPIWDTEEGIDLEKRQRGELERLGWVNKAGGMAQIPIEAAIDLVVKEGP